MKKKGFTLVELLAVIAILAILVIVAMPNVLGMFNQAKSSTFVTEVQEYMSAASTKFMTEALKAGNQGKSIIFYQSLDGTSSHNALDMSGADKGYFVEIDRNGNLDRVVVWDANFCFDSNLAKDKAGNSFTAETGNEIEKADVSVSYVYEVAAGDGVVKKDSQTDYNATASYTITGCQQTDKPAQ